ncbi:MAG: polysaccharide biosynthesis/export family protein [Hyphomonadaceae bacterium]|nr:polysaccharide biosynthesis/export family protein [Hyphomonadaceae bacterium]
MKLVNLARLLLGPVCALVIAACASEPLPSGNAAFAVDTGHEYKLGPGDKVRVTVFGEEALSGEFIVANNGAIAVPLIGEVQAGGMTPPAFQIAVQEKLTSSGMVKSPRVSTDVIAYRPYYILGEVSKPGQYPYAVGLTATKAVATAGGFTYRANNKIIYVTREGTTREVPISLTAASAIGPGDTIRIAERYF